MPKIKNMKRGIVLLLIINLFACFTFANNLRFGSITRPDVNHIQFTVQWDNSWRVTGGPGNYDAVWIFLKYQDCATNYLPWGHVPLSTTASDHTIDDATMQIDVPSDGKGIFIHRAGSGSGNTNLITVTLKIGITDNNYNYQLNGLEMVYVPQGAFYIGDGTGANYAFASSTGGTAAKYIDATVQSTGLTTADYLSNTSWGSTASIPSTFPMGYNAYYVMKYEISQEAYAAFLNTLTYDQQITRFTNSPNSSAGTFAIANLPNPQNCRNGIRIITPGQVSNVPAVVGCDLNLNGTPNETDDGQNIACNWLSWGDLIAFLDWAALRPMTEFEFEKACRGTASVVANEYPWGSTSILAANSGAISYPGANNEVSISSGSGLCAYGVGTYASRGPLRCGFAAGATTNRATAGASYYGIMDLGGNAWEQCLGGYSFNYSAFTTANGDGDLTSTGLANTANWPPLGGGQGGGVLRGGCWYEGAGYCPTSYRGVMTWNTNQNRDARFGGRGVRTAE